MTTHGPFHSLSDTDKQTLTDQLHQGVSVLRATGVLGLNYAHTLGFGHRRRTNPGRGHGRRRNLPPPRRRQLRHQHQDRTGL